MRFEVDDVVRRQWHDTRLRHVQIYELPLVLYESTGVVERSVMISEHGTYHSGRFVPVCRLLYSTRQRTKVMNKEDVLVTDWKALSRLALRIETCSNARSGHSRERVRRGRRGPYERVSVNNSFPVKGGVLRY